jgi:FG-GAP repeat
MLQEILFTNKMIPMKKINYIMSVAALLSTLSIPQKIFSQNVGIGTTAPTEKLHVAGNIKADTIKPNVIKLTPNAGTGKILTSDAAGNASWQTINPGNAGGNVGFGVWGSCDANANIGEYTPIADPTAAYGDFFGSSVAVSSNYFIVGAPMDDVGANTDQGSASIFQFNGTNWVFMQKVTDATGSANDQFGYSVSISGNYAIVGAWLDVGPFGADAGSVSIYQLTGGTWILMNKITDATGGSGDVFGQSVSISGNYAIVGSNGDDIGGNINQGSASIYQYNGSSWVLMQKITDATGTLADNFGQAVSISGNRAIVGASLDDEAYTDQGSAIIFQYNGSNWVQIQKITDGDARAGDNFGNAVSIDGNNVVVGASLDDNLSGSVNNPKQGSASIFWYNGSNWIYVQKLMDDAGKAQDKFGNSVIVSGNYAIVGNFNHDLGTNPAEVDHGAAIIYQRMGLLWHQIQYLTDPAANALDLFGFAVGLDGNTKRFAIGARRYANLSGKVISGKIN